MLLNLADARGMPRIVPVRLSAGGMGIITATRKFIFGFIMLN
ncbi:MAG: hypothetical protein ACP5MI_05350 [Candidatus Kryptoniota bacterium]